MQGTVCLQTTTTTNNNNTGPANPTKCTLSLHADISRQAAPVGCLHRLTLHIYHKFRSYIVIATGQKEKQGGLPYVNVKAAK